MIEPTFAPRRGVLGRAASMLAWPLAMAAVPAAAAPAARSAKDVLDHHLGAFARGLDALMDDYTDASVILTMGDAHRGRVAIRAFFDAFLRDAKPEFWAAFKLTATQVDRDVAYIVWEAPPFVARATDTVLVRQGRILVQTFTAL